MIAVLFRFALLALMVYGIYRLISWLAREYFSGTRRCPRCEGKGWWQNTRNRETCEWCKGSGRIPKDMPV